MDCLTQNTPYRYVLLLALCIWQATPIIGQSYTIDSSGIAEDLSDDPNYVYLYDEEISEAIPIGFDFDFFGITYDEFYFSDNGLITFDGIIGPEYYYPQYLPDATAPNNLIAATWEDMNPYYGFYTYETIGTAPNRMCVIGIASDPFSYYCFNYLQGEVHAQIVLYETSNIIEIHTFEWNVCYTATQGIENADGTEAFAVPGRNDSYWYAYDDYKAFIPEGAGYENDAGIFGNKTTYCEGTQSIFTAVKNFGSEDIDSITINWEWDGVLQTPFYHNSYPIPSNQTYGFYIGEKDFEFDSTYNLKVWTSNPNGAADENPSNDTVSSAVGVGLSGTYTIGGTSPDYPTITSAISALDSYGICDSVIFLIRDGTYSEQIDIDYVFGTYSQARVIFQSESQDSSAVTIQHNATSSTDNYVIRHDGARYVEWHDVTIKAQGAAYSRNVEMINDCSELAFRHCHFMGRNVSSSSNQYAVIYSSGQNEGTVIENSLIEYGSYGMLHTQSSLSPPSTGIKLINNTFTGFDYRALYLNRVQGTQINSNNFTTQKDYTSAIEIEEAQGGFEIDGNKFDLQVNPYYAIDISNTNDEIPIAASISNNFISMAGTTVMRAIYIFYTDSANIAFNNILVNSTQSTSRAVRFYGCNDCAIQNNILAVDDAGLVIETQYSTSGFTSDYNNFYTNAVSLAEYEGTEVSNLTDWQSISGVDGFTISADPLFTDSVDLHVLNPLLNKSGVPIPGIQYDIDGDTRDPSTPDIGADEFIPLGNDAGVFALVSPVDTCVASQDVVVALRNYGSNAISSVDINWSVNSVPQTPVSISETIDTTGSGNDTIHVNLGPLTLVMDSLFVIEAWTTLPNGLSDALPLNDTLHAEYSLPLSGIYTVGGTDPDFPTINDAIDALSNFGVCGDVTMAIRPGLYETQLVIAEIPGISDSARVTFTSENADSSSVTIEYNQLDEDVIEIRGTDYLTFRHLRLHARALYDMRVFALKDNVKYLTIENCILEGTSAGGTGSEILFSATSSVDTGIVIQNNDCLEGYSFVTLLGGSNSNRTHDINISNNKLTRQFNSSIRIEDGSEVTIEKNSIHRFGTQLTYTALILTDVERGLTVNTNDIYLEEDGRGIRFNYINDNDQSTQALLYNNFITTSDNDAVTLDYCKNVGVYHNNVNDVSTEAWHNAFELFNSDNVDVQNNSFVNYGGAAYRLLSSTNTSSDYNNLYSFTYDVASNGTNQPTLADWQSATGLDANSLSVDPIYLATADLHIFNVSLDSAATPIVGITTDYDGDLRNTTHPDIGADEIGSLSDNLQAQLILPKPPFAHGIQNVALVVRNVGSNDVTSFTIDWTVNDTSQTQYNFVDTLPYLQTDTLTIGSYDFGFGQPYHLKAWTSSPNGNNDMYAADDTARADSLFAGVAGVLTIGGTNPDFDSITQAVDAMVFGGVSDSTFFKIRPGTYTEAVQFSQVEGMSCSTPVVFESENGDSTSVTWDNNGLGAVPALQLAGADGLHFRNLSLRSYNGNLVTINNESHCNTFERCHLLGNTVSVTSNTQAVVLSSTDDDTSNVFIHNTIEAGSFGLYLLGSANEGYTEIRNNTFKNVYYRSVFIGNAISPKITSNNVQIDFPVHNSHSGFVLSNCDEAVEISANTINLISGTGIWLDLCNGTASDSIYITNNYVFSGSTSAGYGIYTYYSTLVNVYHNTTFITGSHTASKCLNTYFGSNVNAINNIFYNEAGGTAIYHQNDVAIGVSDYNDVYAPGGNVSRTNLVYYPTLLDWQGQGYDLNSITEDPLFVAPGDVHITNAMLNDIGSPLAAVTTDIEGDLRDPVTPDIGADEFSLVTDDVGMVSINYPTEPFPSGLNTIFIKFVNNGNDTLTSMQVDFEVDSIPQPPYFWTGLLASGETYDSLDIGEFDFTPYRSHEIKVWVSNPNGMTDGLAANDTLEATNLYPALLGTYTIGGSDPDFESIREALAPLDSGGVAGPVTFNIRDGVYHDTLVINEFPGSGCETPVIFQSESQDSAAVTISNLGLNNYPITLNGADGLIFRYLTVETVNTSYRRTIYYHSGADCNTFSNNALHGYDVSSYSSNWAVIYSDLGADSATVIENNTIDQGSVGIYIRGADNTLSGTVIRDNVIKDNHGVGIYAYWEDGMSVEGNTVTNSFLSSFDAIQVSDCDSTLRIVSNYINGEAGEYGLYISGCSAASGAPSLVANNMISIGGSNRSYPLVATSSDHIEFVYNTLHAHSSTGMSTHNTAFYYNNSTNLELYNNILANSSSAGYAMTGSATGLSDANNNCYYSNSATNFIDANGFTETNLAGWQSSSSLDINSIESDPTFTSPSDLHASLVLLNGTAIPYPAITTDIDGELRDPTDPDIGADEFVPATSNDAGIMGIINPVVPFAAGSQSVQAVIKNFGGLNLTSANVRWIINGFEQTQYNWTGNLIPGACDTVTLGTYDFAAAAPHALQFWTEQPNGVPDSTQLNDTLFIEDLYAALSGTYTVGGVLPDINLFIQLEKALNRGGIIGDVTFDIRDGIYHSQVYIGDFPRVSDDHYVQFQSESGDSSAVILSRNFNSSDNYTVQLDETHHIRFKEMTLSSTKGRVVDIRNGSHNMRFENCAITGKELPGNSNNYACMYSPSTTEDSITITNCVFKYGSFGITFEGSSGDIEHHLQITNCQFSDQDYIPVRIRRLVDLNVSNNTFEAVQSQTTMYLLDCDSLFTIANNRINLNNGGTGIYAERCSVDPGTPNGHIYNNYVRVAGTSQAFGMYFAFCNNLDIEHNTIRVDNNKTSGFPQNQTAGLRFYSGYGNAMTNNNIACLNGALAYYGWGISGNYNNLYTTGPVLAYHNYSHPDILDLGSSTGQNLNSVSTDPLFIDINEPYAQQAALNNAGTPIGSITVDIDGESRDVGTPDIGADEFTPLVNDLGVSLLVAPLTDCGLSATESITVRIQNYGSAAQSGCDIAYSIDGSSWTVENIGATSIPGGEYLDHTFVPTEDLSTPGQYELSFYVDKAGDTNSANDSLWDNGVEHFPALSDTVSNMIPSPGTIDLETTVSLSWAPALNANRYDVYIWEDGNTQPGTPQVSDLTQINTLYSNLNYSTTYNWRVVAKNICDEMTPSDIQQFSTRTLPDLVVDTVIAPPSMFSGQQIEVEWVVRNQGAGSTQSEIWSDAVYLSTDATLNLTYDTYVGATQNLTALDDGQSYSNTAMVTIPEGFAGNFYVFVTSDRWSELVESNNSNNAERTPSTVQILLTPSPDLMVETIAVPLTTFGGQPMPIQYTVRNTGLGPTTSGQWTDRIVFNDDPVNFAGGTIIANINYNGNLEPDSGYTKSLSANIPITVSGEYYIHVITDINNQEFENASDANNASISDTIDVIVPPPADLVAYNISFPDSVSNNEVINVIYTVENQGAVDASGTWYDYLYTSISPIYNTNFLTHIRTLTWYGPVAPGMPMPHSTTWRVPNTASGEYFFYLHADKTNKVFEYEFENNNVVRSTGTFVIVHPDLHPDSLTYPAMANTGETLDIQWNTVNLGPGDLNSRSYSYYAYLSTDTNFDPGSDVYLDDFRFSGQTLPDGDTTSFEETVILPDNTVGTHYILLVADAASQVIESDENNNITVGQSIDISPSPSPDLQPREIVVPDTVFAGEGFALSYELVNAGSDSNSIATSDSILLSFSPTWNPISNTFLDQLNVGATLAAGDSQQVDAAMFIPSDQASNFYYVYVKTDAENDVFEAGGEGNNIDRSGAIFVMPPRPIDVVVDTAYVLQDTVDSGQNITFGWTVRNQGARTASSVSWHDAVYLSVDASLDRTLDTRLVEYNHSSLELEPGESESFVRNFITPLGLNGEYYVFVYADDYDSNDDVDPSNNYKAHQMSGVPHKVVIRQSASPDLVVQNLVAPADVFTGQVFETDITVGNIGTDSAGHWLTKLYLSTDDEINNGDLLLRSQLDTFGLDTNQSRVIILDAIVPSTVFGNYVLIAQIDAQDDIFEYNGEDNNTLTRSIQINLPPPSDLEVTAITIPDSANAGDLATVSWTTINNGSHPANGSLREIIYFTADTVLDIGDQTFGVLDTNIYLPPGSSVTRNHTSSLDGLARGDFHALLQTDAYNNIYESSDSNNTELSNSTLNIDIEELYLDSITADVFANGRRHYFRLEIPASLAGESLRITIDGDSSAIYNEIFLRYGDVPTLSDYDINGIYAVTPDQDLIFEGLEAGTYYIMCRGYIPGQDTQNVTIHARIIDFELLTVTPKRITRNTQTTIELVGTQMDTLRHVYLARDSTLRIYADSIYTIDNRRAFATFTIDSVPFYDLPEAPLGFYDVQAERYDGKIAELHNAIEVIEGGLEPELQLVMEHPGTVPRFSRPMKITVYIQNSGDADLIGEKFIFEAPYGNQLAYTLEDLYAGNTSLALEILAEGAFGPPGILPPKAVKVVEVFAYSRPHPTFALTPINE